MFTTCVRFLFPVNNYSYSYSAEYCSELFGIRPNTEKPIFGTALIITLARGRHVPANQHKAFASDLGDD